MFGREERPVRGDIFPFAEAFKAVFIIMVITAIVSLLFQFIWVNVVDSNLTGKIIERTIESTTKTLESFGTPEEAIEEAMAGIEESVLNQYTLVGLLKSIFWGFLASAVIAAIISFFIKKEETFA